MDTRTKIICTIGPSCNRYEKIVELICAGMNVARLNFSHGTHEQHLQTINLLKEARNELKCPLAIMLDTCGPEVRIGKIAGGEIALAKGDRWQLRKEVLEGNKEQVSILPGYVLDNIPADAKILFDDGYISSRILEKNESGVLVEIENSGVIKSGKGVNIPNVRLNLPDVTEKDINDIAFGCANDLDIIALSFVRSAENIITVRNLIEEYGGSMLVVAKIENHEGLENFDSILQVADGVMIARGDLGVEIPLSQVPKLQKEMIRKCYLAGKPSVTATQMLESMIYNPRPTRAEVSDVANAIYDSTSSVMLSGETAVGKYPIEAVQVMKSIIKEAEQDFEYIGFFEKHVRLTYADVPSAVTLATVKTAYSSNASCIFAFTSSGGTASLLSRLRPKMPIVAMTPKIKTFHRMALNWGVTPYLGKQTENLNASFREISEYALDRHLVSYGDLVVMTAGSTFGITGTTNMMIVENIGDVLVRAHMGIGERIYGNVRILLAPGKGAEPYTIRGQLLVIAKYDDSLKPYIHEAGGVILQNHIDDVQSEAALLEEARRLGKPAIVRADGASKVLKQGQLVTMDPEKALIYKGVVLT